MSMSDRFNTFWDSRGYRVPYYHRRQHYRPGLLRHITDNFIPQWKLKRRKEGAQYGRDKHLFLDSRTWSEEPFQLHVGKMRLEVKQAFSHILPHARIIEDITLVSSKHAFVAFRVCVSEHAFAFRCVCVFGTRVSGLWVVVRGWWVAVVGWQPKWLRIGVRCSAFRMRFNCVSKNACVCVSKLHSGVPFLRFPMRCVRFGCVSAIAFGTQRLRVRLGGTLRTSRARGVTAFARRHCGRGDRHGMISRHSPSPTIRPPRTLHRPGRRFGPTGQCMCIKWLAGWLGCWLADWLAGW